MATSGSKDFQPDVADYIEEAFERCGFEVRTGYDLKTAKRSLNLLFADWANRGLNRWTISQDTITLADGTVIAKLVPEGLLVIDAVAPLVPPVIVSDTENEAVAPTVIVNVPRG